MSTLPRISVLTFGLLISIFGRSSGNTPTCLISVRRPFVRLGYLEPVWKLGLPPRRIFQIRFALIDARRSQLLMRPV